jgi:glucose 1-dehydrogenase
MIPQDGRPMRFVGKVAVVTGAARGIGRGVAERLAREGAAVVLVDVVDEGEAVASELRAQGLDVRFLRADVSVRAQIDHVVERVVHDLGTIDVLVNNAGIIRTASFFATTEQDFDEVFAINLRGMFSFTQAVAKVMLAAGTAGSIVNMSSITAVHGAEEIVAYSASKGAVSAMTRSTAMALAAHGIRVNAVGPGSIATEAAVQIHDRDPSAARRILSRTPLGRMGTPEDVGATVAFLASDDASYFTGQVLYPEGGRMSLGYVVDPDAQRQP